MHVLVRFANIAARNQFSTRDLHQPTAEARAWDCDYSLASLRYDLFKLRAKGFIQKLPRPRRFPPTLPGTELFNDPENLRLFSRTTCHRRQRGGHLHPRMPGGGNKQGRLFRAVRV
jgi:hypothetical protein